MKKMGLVGFQLDFLDLLEAGGKMLVLEHGVAPIGADGLGWTVDR